MIISERNVRMRMSGYQEGGVPIAVAPAVSVTAEAASAVAVNPRNTRTKLLVSRYFSTPYKSMSAIREAELKSPVLIMRSLVPAQGQ